MGPLGKSGIWIMKEFKCSVAALSSLSAGSCGRKGVASESRGVAMCKEIEGAHWGLGPR